MNCPDLPLRLRLACAEALMPYYFERQKTREG